MVMATFDYIYFHEKKRKRNRKIISNSKIPVFDFSALGII